LMFLCLGHSFTVETRIERQIDISLSWSFLYI
jgi:hypothetical protein